ncbi:hypothetical protein AQZ52_02510 [Novosphingobium fuchskuhlense]|uniref:Uncharacterized protein n=1 Tax=Novosphingobium fuchskuhlense TaxID=1117702 RepID=A0A124JVE1_9SPHN|nr:hypothetical protein [Novosphingobium fuchskuhlense]KUR72183.1 hypothetical protein AQZ52_02510 [Novosphingobium fuchskuhlense]
MILSMLLLSGLQVPDPAPALDAVKTCDRVEMRKMIAGEPHRRTEFAAAAYAEQRAIARERATLLAAPSADRGEGTPAGEADTANALGQLDGRQKQLDDARAVETSWRALFDEMRADFLANCNGRKDSQ